MSRANDMVYPLDHSVNIGPNGTIQCGLTIREYYAGLAMQGLCAKYGTEALASSQIAEAAVIRADALLLALSQVTP